MAVRSNEVANLAGGRCRTDRKTCRRAIPAASGPVSENTSPGAAAAPWLPALAASSACTPPATRRSVNVRAHNRGAIFVSANARFKTCLLGGSQPAIKSGTSGAADEDYIIASPDR
jgi:hypothetical protein